MISLAALGAVVGASVIGSLHCAGMCGPLACSATMPRTTTLTSAGRPVAAPVLSLGVALYHGSRLMAYAILGAAAGAIGSGVDLAGRLGGLQPAAAYLAAGTIIVLGLWRVARALGWIRPHHAPSAGGPVRWWAAANRWPAPVRAASLGFLTALLPCGWLWLFIVSAAGTGSPLSGALTLGAFWLGTLPSLLLVGTGLPRLLTPVLARVPVLTGLLIVAAGVFTLVTRTPTASASSPSPIPSCCHGD